MKKNKQDAFLRVSLLPLLVLVGLIFGAGYFLLKDEIKLPSLRKNPTIQRLEGFPTVIYTDKQIEKTRKVITSEQELAEFLNLIDETGILTVKEKVDFEKNVVVAVSTETNEETGHKIKIRKVYEDKVKDKILIEFEEVNPEDDCKMEIDKNIAVDLVMLSKTDAKVDFEKVTKVIECEDSESDNENTDESTESNSKTESTE
ncbi:MAG TPA: hypothetical protein PLX95_01090 [bacterium]|nr:hypothetical protein [Patescibacteria group bacterium]HPD73872.1 hypothetical protein [bacterium]